MDDLGLEVNQVTEDVTKQFAQLNDPEFYAVVQPAIEKVPLATFEPDIVEDLLSDLDCFHPSLCTDQGMAVSRAALACCMHAILTLSPVLGGGLEQHVSRHWQQEQHPEPAPTSNSLLPHGQ